MSDNERKTQVIIDGNPDGLIAALRSSQTAISGFVSGTNQAFSTLSAFGGLPGVAAAVMGILGGGAAKAAIDTTQDVVGEVVKLSKTLGMSAEEASVMRVALDDAFLTVDDVVMGTSRLTKQLISNEDAFKKLGVETRDTNGHFRDTPGIMLDVNSKLKNLKEGTDQNVAGMSIYGKSWNEVRGLLKLNNTAMEEAKKRAEELHLIIGDEGVKQTRDYKLAMKDLDDVSESLKVRLGIFLVPILTKLATTLGDTAVKVIPPFIFGLTSIEAEFIRMAMLADKAGGTITTLGMLLYGPGNAIGNKNSKEKFEQFAQWNMMFEARYQAGDKALQTLAFREMGLDADGNPITYKKREKDKTPQFWDPSKTDKKTQHGTRTDASFFNKAWDAAAQAVDFESALEMSFQSDGFDRLNSDRYENGKTAVSTFSLLGPGGAEAFLTNWATDKAALDQAWAEEQQWLNMEYEYKDALRQQDLEAERQAQDLRLQAGQNTTQGLMALTQAMYAFSGAKNRQLFELNKVANIANATMNTYTGATRALADVPYPYNLIAAASVIASGMAQVASISKTSMGGGAVSSAFSASTASSNVTATNPGGSTSEAPLTITINVEGNLLAEDRWIEEKLAPTIKELSTRRNVDFGFAPI